MHTGLFAWSCEDRNVRITGRLYLADVRLVAGLKNFRRNTIRICPGMGLKAACHMAVPERGIDSSNSKVRFPRQPRYSRNVRPGGTGGRVRNMVFPGSAHARECGTHSVRGKEVERQTIG